MCDWNWEPMFIDLALGCTSSVRIGLAQRSVRCSLSTFKKRNNGFKAVIFGTALQFRRNRDVQIWCWAKFQPVGVLLEWHDNKAIPSHVLLGVP
jgi:hypothetical protein